MSELSYQFSTNPAQGHREADGQTESVIYSAALVLLLLVGAMASREIAFATSATLMALDVAYTRSISGAAVKFLGPIFLILFVGLVAAIPANELVYDIIRDAFYWMRLIPLAYCGYAIGRRVSLPKIILILAATGAFLAASYLINYIIATGSGSYTRETLRLKVGRGYAEWFYGIGAAIVMLSHFPKASGARWFAAATLALLILAAAFSDSRTSLIVMVIIGLCVVSWRVTRLMVFALCPLVTVLFAIISTPLHTVLFGTFFAEHFHDLPRSIAELITLDQTNFVDINEYWRSFESAAAFRAYSQSNALEYALGHGFGTQFALGIHFTRLGETNVALPISHNAIPYVLLKSGLAGLCAFLFFIYRTLFDALKIGGTGSAPSRAISGLIVGIGMFWLISTPTTRGFIDLGSSGLIVCGALLAAQELASRRQRESWR